jgi:hypothetical protein
VVVLVVVLVFVLGWSDFEYEDEDEDEDDSPRVRSGLLLLRIASIQVTQRGKGVRIFAGKSMERIVTSVKIENAADPTRSIGPEVTQRCRAATTADPKVKRDAPNCSNNDAVMLC